MKVARYLFLFTTIAAIALLINKIQKKGETINEPSKYTIPFYIDMEIYYQYSKAVRKMQPNETFVYFSQNNKSRRDYIKLKNMQGSVNFYMLFLPPDTFFIINGATSRLGLEIIETISHDFHLINVSQKFKFTDDDKIVEEISYVSGNDTVFRESLRNPSVYSFSADPVLSKAQYIIKIMDNLNKYYIYDSNERFVYGAEGTIRELPK